MSDDFEKEIVRFLGQADGWLSLLECVDREAEAWAATYQRSGALRVTKRIRQAVRRMHRGDMEAARTLLAGSSGAAATELKDASDSVCRIVDMYHAAAVAYDHYRHRQWEQVEAMFQHSLKAVDDAIDRHRFLIIFGVRYLDVQIQRAQVARARYRWDTMARHVEIGWQMLEGQFPLRLSEGGDPFWFRDIVDFVASIDDGSPEREESTAGHLDPRWVRRRFRALVAEAYALPWMIIPYH
ncbi:MAG: hypothetical protein MPN21_13070 [Thermoanaerobaculia bacterium]|nr:hypothetical protein [Thermoanaerobaculia bacterium]